MKRKLEIRILIAVAAALALVVAMVQGPDLFHAQDASPSGNPGVSQFGPSIAEAFPIGEAGFVPRRAVADR